jgi:hypothetical protein
VLRIARLHYLEAIPEWIVNKEAAPAFDCAIGTRLMRCGPAACRNRIEIIDLERDMGFLGRSKVGFDAEVELHVAEFKPSPTSRSESGGLRNLLQPKDIAVEVARLGLTRWRHRELNVIDAKGRHS